MARGKVELSGPFFARGHFDAIKKATTAAIEGLRADVEAEVKKAAPKSKHGRDGKPAGHLRDSLAVTVREDERRVVLSITSTAESAKGFPYGAAQNARGGFASDAVAGKAAPIKAAVQKAVDRFVDRLNSGSAP